MEGYIILFIIIDGMLAILPANVAKRKGKDFAAWYIYGFFLWIIAMLHAISLPEQNVYKSNINTNKTTNNVEFKVLSHGSLENNIDLNSPVEVLEWDILSKNDGNIYFNILFRNLYQGVISAIKLELQGFNSFNEVVKVEGKDTFICYIQDLDGQLGCEFNNRNPVPLPEKDIRKLNISIKEVVFGDGDFIYKNKKNEIKKEIEYITENEELMTLKKHTKTGICYANQESNLWICVCGRPNYENIKSCVRCNLDKEYVFTELSREKILEEIEEQKKIEAEEEKNKILKEQEFVEKQKKVRKRKVIYISVFISVIVIVALCSTFLNRLKTTPLTKLVKEQNIKKIDISIKLGNEINEIDENGDTPLNVAIKEGKVEIVQKLIEHGVELNKEDENGETPFDVANRLRDKEIIDLILEHGGNGFKNIKAELNIDNSIIRAGFFSTVNGEVNKISAISKVYYKNGKETEETEYFFTIKENNYMYKGKIKNGFFDGFGALYLQGYGYGREDFGKLYDGGFKEGKFNGYGRFFWDLKSSKGVETVCLVADLINGNINGNYFRYYSDGNENDKGTCYNGIVTSNVYGVKDENSK
ncbi:ankyrin repeat domain-containing protein [Clostridium senegalense]